MGPRVYRRAYRLAPLAPVIVMRAEAPMTHPTPHTHARRQHLAPSSSVSRGFSPALTLLPFSFLLLPALPHPVCPMVRGDEHYSFSVFVLVPGRNRDLSAGLEENDIRFAEYSHKSKRWSSRKPGSTNHDSLCIFFYNLFR